jgi:hypothetical protein
MVEAIVASDPDTTAERRLIWRDIEKTTTVGNPYESGSSPPQDIERYFRKHWITFSDLARMALGFTAENRHQLWADTPILETKLHFERETSLRIIAAYDAYTRLVAGTWNGTDDQLEQYVVVLEECIRHIHARFSAALADQWGDE